MTSAGGIHSRTVTSSPITPPRWDAFRGTWNKSVEGSPFEIGSPMDTPGTDLASRLNSYLACRESVELLIEEYKRKMGFETDNIDVLLEFWRGHLSQKSLVSRLRHTKTSSMPHEEAAALSTLGGSKKRHGESRLKSRSKREDNSSHTLTNSMRLSSKSRIPPKHEPDVYLRRHFLMACWTEHEMRENL
eukprot:CAMPEP_0115042030 /NCGR_PEP_ID=MMETSP0216-20121206/46023_1 /TAXON_ID=223996 /ORGANISM="Protocruzia adherens, Strain Boccale" /LENGTH=188 /DNA_ID=CAMNT_0002424067 /DNA_START=200 /DNA_END=762 /DNA_ORIENTATION=-